MFQGTGSDVGKSLVVAGLCRAFASRGLEVRPFKPQNMSNNAAVTPDGGEIGRAQALQARACRVAPSVHMNPVLLKPQSETGAQVVVRGRVVGAAKAREYQAMKPRLMAAVLESFGRLKAEADLVLVEGAGSASEVNLRSGDIANMGFARAADTPVILIGDIDRGGVIAQIVGTKVVIAPEDAAMVVGFLINKFRGDPSLFAEGLRLIEERTSWPSLGMIPHFAAAQKLPAEDAMALERAGPTRHARRDDRRAPPRAHRQFRRVRSALARAERRSRHGRAGRAAPRLRSRHSAGKQGDDRRSRVLSRAGLGHRSLRACPARRPCARAVRRLSDAGPPHRRSRRRRRPCRRSRGARPARRRDDAAGATRRWSP